MHRQVRSLLVLATVVAAVAACSAPDSALTSVLSPASSPPSMQRIKASDSLLALTDVAFSDSARVLQRTSPLAADVSVTALIGATGGSLAIDAAGARLVIPAGALHSPTQITMTALKGSNVAYEFAPHGTIFFLPVRVTQDLALTAAGSNATLVNGLHGSYFSTPIDSSYVDASHTIVRVIENQLGYREQGSTKLSFYVGHFSGYLVSMGAH